MYPISGGFYTYATRFIDPSFGFAVGWNYLFLWLTVLPLELTVCALVIQYWDEQTSVAAWITIFLVAVIVVNIFGGIGFAEEEFCASLIKLTAITTFMIVALVLVLGGGPHTGRYNEYWGTRYWENPGAFRNGFRGFCSVFVTAAFSLTGTELVGLAAAETKNPVKSLPGAVKRVFWRIVVFYILGLFFIGLLVPSDDPRLLSNQAITDVKASPWVLIGNYAGLRGLDHFMNSVILVSVLSIGVSSVYGGSRTLTALAQQGYAPKLFTYIDRSGRPLFSVLVLIMTGPLAYVNLSATGPQVFEWLQALSGMAVLFSWGAICLSHIRFRKAWAHNGHSLDEIAFKALFGVWGSWVSLALCFIVMAAQVGSRETGPTTEEARLTSCLVIHRHCTRRHRGRQHGRGLLQVVPGAARGAGLLAAGLRLEALGLAAPRPNRRRHGPARAGLGRDQRLPGARQGSFPLAAGASQAVLSDFLGVR